MTERPAAIEAPTGDQRAGPAVGPTSNWRVLIVDDEPEVHEVTQLMLEGTRFCGLPIQLHSAYSAEDAKRFLQQNKETALILLDVVMETDDAGLRLSRFIRDELQNDEVQVVLRTGQPGQAPERDVILNYDINGYFLKTEVTSQKLYSIVISALRTYNHIKTLKKYRHLPVHHGRKHLVSAERRSRIASELRSAIENDGISLLAEPQFQLNSDAVVGFEMLLRWRRRDGAEIKAAEFIPALEEDIGLAMFVGEWALRRACATGKAWWGEGVDGVGVSVNLFAGQLTSGDLVDVVKRCLEETELRPGCLELEVPESVMVKHPRTAPETLSRLQALGVNVAIDEVGSGMASLSQLKHLHPTRLKIDRSFIRNLVSDPEKSAITRSIIALAHTMGMAVAAKGVERQDDLEFLRWEGCEIAQGSLLAEPMPVAQVPAFLRVYPT